MCAERCQVEETAGLADPISIRPYEEYQARYQSWEPVGELKIESKADIARIRRELDTCFAAHLSCWSKVRLPVLLAVSEAVTNVVKYTPGGRLLVYADTAGLSFHVIDYGTGLDLDVLPSLLFGKGFSTSSSLGMGFPIMDKYADAVTAYTSGRGTILVLQFDIDC